MVIFFQNIFLKDVDSISENFKISYVWVYIRNFIIVQNKNKNKK